ncbi:MAG: hypothetical protein ACLFTT_04070 [Candidatus Hydrogenedentota bacterium]
MKKGIKVLFYSGSGLLWIGAAVMLIELAALYQHHRDRDNLQLAEALQFAQRNDHKRILEHLNERAMAGEQLPLAPPRTDYFKRDHAGRAELARQRGELILACTPAGQIAAIWPAPESVPLAEFQARIRPGRRLQAAFGEQATGAIENLLAKIGRPSAFHREEITIKTAPETTRYYVLHALV